MDFLKRLFGKHESTSVKTDSSETQQPSMKEIFNSPSMLAEWVFSIISSFSYDDDLARAPDEETRLNLNITPAQIERLTREESILRAAGAGVFVRVYYDDTFYLRFFSHLYKPVANHIYSNPLQDQIDDTRDAIEVYVTSMCNEENSKSAAIQYMRRIYDDSDNYIRMMTAGVGNASLVKSHVVFELIRNEYFKVTQGMPYESAKLLMEELEKIKNESNL